MTEHEMIQSAYERALREVARNPDGSIDETALVECVARMLDFDETKARQGLARRIVARRKRPGQTPPEGQLVLPIPDLPPYAYEPTRLVEDDRGNLIENAKARPSHKAAEARRAQEAAKRAQDRARRLQEEYVLYSEWAMEQLRAGRPGNEITFDTCVRELHLWKDADPEPNETPDPDGSDEESED